MRRSPQASSRLASALALGAVVLAAGAAGPAAAYDPEGLAPGDHAAVTGLCRNVVGLRPGIALYEACVESLSASARDVADGRTLASSRAYCLARNLPPGSPALARCELDASRSAQAVTPVLLAPPPAFRPPARSYWYASNAEIHRREETACADLGLEPVGAGFARCVASLDASLFAADNSAH